MTDQNCGNCRYFNQYPDVDYGSCRIRSTPTAFPIRCNAEWCGEWVGAEATDRSADVVPSVGEVWRVGATPAEAPKTVPFGEAAHLAAVKEYEALTDPSYTPKTIEERDEFVKRQKKLLEPEYPGYTVFTNVGGFVTAVQDPQGKVVFGTLHSLMRRAKLLKMCGQPVGGKVEQVNTVDPSGLVSSEYQVAPTPEGKFPADSLEFYDKITNGSRWMSPSLRGGITQWIDGNQWVLLGDEYSTSHGDKARMAFSEKDGQVIFTKAELAAKLHREEWRHLDGPEPDVHG